ncbi:MAG: ATP-dependent Clp protease ATP-binding subunit [Planctomycetes bacterium]|nr:ATP-dependent Clp protease ATP-binding subunit [Planctomycetota bacterium]
MERRTASVIYKYFDLTDEFVRIRQVAPAELAGALGSPERLDKQGYRRAVLRACVVGWDAALEVELAKRSELDRAAAEELLYQICVDVNPALEIHHVQLPVSGALSAVAENTPAQRSATWRTRAADLEARLERRIVGQRHALRSLTHRVRKHAAGLGRNEGPLGAFLLVGNTGVGKTALAKALAEMLFEDRSALIRVDCSEFSAGHEYSKLIGAPPGYVGHEDGGQLTEALQSGGGKIVLFDEIEKAHAKLHQVLLQVLDDGRLTDGRGKTACFRDTLILMTSNVGTRELHDAAEAVGFGGQREVGTRERQSLVEGALKKVFAPEFLGRLDEVLVFDDLGVSDCERIAALEVEKLRAKVRALGVGLRVQRAVLRWIAESAWSPKHGAREVARSVSRELEDKIAELLFDAALPAGARIDCTLHRGRPRVQLAAARAAAR